MSHPKERDLALWAGDDLPAAEAARVEDHLAECPACRDRAGTLRASRAAVESLAAEPIDETALARIRHGLRRRLAEEEARAARRRRSAAVYLVGALAAALAAAAVGLGIWSGSGRPPEPERTARAERPEPREPDREAVAPPPRELPEAVPERERPATRPAPPAPPPPEPPEQRAALAPAPEEPTESMVIKVVSDDPNVVYYWLVEPTSS